MVSKQIVYKREMKVKNIPHTYKPTTLSSVVLINMTL